MRGLVQAGLIETVGLVGRAGYSLEADIDAVPGIDCHDHEGQVGDFLFGKLAANPLIDLVGNAALRQFRQGFGPGQRGALAGNEQVRFPPDGKSIGACSGAGHKSCLSR